MDGGAEGVEDVFDIFGEARAFFDEAVTAAVHWGVDGSGDGEDFAALFGGHGGGGEGAAFEGGFDDEAGAGHAADDAVAAREVAGGGRGVEGVFAEEQAFVEDFGG